MKMYRYAKRKYSKALLNMGSIRIGTLHDFRNIEHSKGIADPAEGTKTVRHIVNQFMYDGGDPTTHDTIDARAMEAFSAITVDDTSRAFIQGLRLSRTINHPDFYLLCSSDTLSQETMAEFEGADSCVVIEQPEEFYRCITNALNRITPVRFAGVRKVIYTEREESWNGQDWGISPAVIKEPEFKGQHELRAIWVPRASQPIEPRIIFDHKLGALCKQVAV